ncbi:MAG TPA: helix-turn-helix domain-containing protein [Ohtaekwangia sp.]|nr:helix-turn-helix domain-containing protein [Ohtaekwangia sp.]
MQKNEARSIPCRDQLITLGDLENFKKELLDEIKNLLQSHSSRTHKKWLKSPEVRTLLGISTGTLQTLRLNGSLNYSKLGGTIFYDYDDIAKLMKENEGG